MAEMKKFASGFESDATPQNLKPIKESTGNIYRSLSIISKRSNQISTKIKEELHAKLEEFAITSDSLEEVTENREQIEISRFYERLPNPAILAKEEFLEGKVYYRHPDEEEEA